ncbi:hypothetical protein Tco_0512401 [Tanacetum coccineum]
MKMTSSSSSHFHLPDVITNINSDHPYNHIYNDLQNDYYQQLGEHKKFLSSKQVYIDDKTTHEDENEDFGVINFHGKIVKPNRMYVDASKFGDLLPDKWKILLSLRPGVSPPSLYCKKFVR